MRRDSLTALQHPCTQAYSQVLLNCPQATEWCLLVCATPVEHVALILVLCVSGFSFLFFLASLLLVLKQPWCWGDLAHMEPYCPWLFPFKSKALPCGWQSGYILTSSYDKFPLLCQAFSLSSLSKFTGWDTSWSQMRPYVQYFFGRLTHAEGGNLASC